MKKVLFPILALVLAVGLALPMAAPAMALIPVTVGFEGLTAGNSVEGLGTVNTYLNIQTSGGNSVALQEGSDAATYGAPNGSGSIKNGGLNGTGGFGDLDRVHDYVFTFSPGLSVSEFSITMFDYGDYNPTRATYHEIKLVAYDTGMAEVDDDVLKFNSPSATNPRSSSNPDYGDLYYSGDAVNASAGTEPGNWTFTVSGTGITTVKLISVSGLDPNIGFDDIEFTVEEASIDLTKTGPDCAHEGDEITYTYDVHNDGDVSLTGLAVTDSLGITVSPVESGGYNVGDTNTDGNFDPCETWIFEGSYTVPWFYDCYTVENTATASAWYEAVEVTAESNLVVVDIVRNPAIEVTKSGPQGGWFQTVEATYYYDVHNDGDCSLTSVSVTDDKAGSADPVMDNGYNVGDDSENDLLDPCETWKFTASALLECECQTITVFTNKATVTAEDVKGTSVDDTACWSVIVFQWLPRTIGFWGNWDNHIDPDDMGKLVDKVNTQSSWFPEEQPLATAGVHDLLLTPPPKGKMDIDKAKDLFQKQLLAAWLSVKSYENHDGFGDLNWAMDCDALVYPPEEDPITVKDFLEDVESAVALMTSDDDIDDVLKFKDLLEDLNSAEVNGYEMFIYPEFEPGVCPMELRKNPPYKNVPAITEPVVGSVWMYPDDVDDELVVFVYLGDGAVDTSYGIYLETYNGTTGGGANWLDWDRLGTLTTDNHGHGSYYKRVPLSVISEPSVTGPDYYLQIVVSYPIGSWGAQSFGTDNATITID